MNPFAWLSRWWHDRLNRWSPWRCHVCERKSESWADRCNFSGRYVWADHALYEGKTEEMYCPEHKHLMPEPQGGQEARRRFYAGEPQ